MLRMCKTLNMMGRKRSFYKQLFIENSLNILCNPVALFRSCRQICKEKPGAKWGGWWNFPVWKFLSNVHVALIRNIKRNSGLLNHSVSVALSRLLTSVKMGSCAEKVPMCDTHCGVSMAGGLRKTWALWVRSHCRHQGSHSRMQKGS